MCWIHPFLNQIVYKWLFFLKKRKKIVSFFLHLHPSIPQSLGVINTRMLRHTHTHTHIHTHTQSTPLHPPPPSYNKHYPSTPTPTPVHHVLGALIFIHGSLAFALSLCLAGPFTPLELPSRLPLCSYAYIILSLSWLLLCSCALIGPPPSAFYAPALAFALSKPLSLIF